MGCDGERLVYVRYLDHVLFHRVEPLFLKPQVREAVGWLVYECDHYLTMCWDRDAEPPTLKGGDPKASGLVLLKSDILERQFVVGLSLNCQQTTRQDEYALKPNERKTHRPTKGKTAT